MCMCACMYNVTNALEMENFFFFYSYTNKAEGYPWVVSIFPVCESHETCQEHIHAKIEITPNSI